MKIEQIFFVNVTLSLRLREQIIFINVTLSFMKTIMSATYILSHIYNTSHNLSYVLFMKLKIEQKFDRNRINLLNIDIWRIQYMD